ncbi:MAG: MFS transporter [Candidatus Thorarchaeota archaeon]
MDELSESKSEQTLQNGVSRTVPLLGLLTLLTIGAAALLHVNQPEFILDRFPGITEFDYSLFDSMLYLSYLIVGILTGIFSDRWKKRRLFVFVGAFGSIPFYYLMTTAPSYSLLLLYRFIQGSFTVMIWQTMMTMALDHSNIQNRGKSMGVFGAFLALAMGMGPAVGGLVASYGVFMPYYTASGINVVVLLIAFLALREPLLPKSRPSLVESISIARRQPRLFIPGLFNFIDRLHIGFILTALPLFLSVVLGVSESLRGMSLAIFALPFIILQYPMGRFSDKHGRYGPLIIGSIGYGITLMLVGYLGSFGFTVLLLMLAILGIFSGVTAPPSMALVGDVTSQNDSAMAMGFFNFLGNVGITVGPLLFGVVILFSDFIAAFAIAGLLELATLSVNLVLIRILSSHKKQHFYPRKQAK